MTELKHNEADKNFEIIQDGKHAGLITYTWGGDGRFIIDHTEVDEEFGGLGLGRKLLEAAVRFAREKGVKIIPQCTFAKKILEKTPEYQDLL